MTEKVIELNEVKEEPKEEQPKEKTKHDITVIEPKPVTKLSNEEKDLIISNYRDGIIQPNFTVKELKNGTLKIVKTTNKGGYTKPPENVEKPVTPVDKTSHAKYTNEQMLIQEIIDLNSKMDVMLNKHKKLKKKYKKMRSDIYVDLDEVEEKPKEEEQPVIQEEQRQETPPPQLTEIDYNNALYNLRKRGWRRSLYA